MAITKAEDTSRWLGREREQEQLKRELLEREKRNRDAEMWARIQAPPPNRQSLSTDESNELWLRANDDAERAASFLPPGPLREMLAERMAERWYLDVVAGTLHKSPMIAGVRYDPHSDKYEIVRDVRE